MVVRLADLLAIRRTASLLAGVVVVCAVGSILT